MNRRHALTAVASALLGHSLATRAAEDYPHKAIRIIVPYAAGGGVDNITRAVAAHLGASLKQPIIVDNRPGASGNIGADAAAKAPADGYTLLMGATFLAFNRATTKGLPYDSAKDLVPIARTGEAPFVLVVPAAMPLKTVGDLVAYMKANPDKAAYGGVGAGAPANLIFSKNTGTNPVQILYKGGAAAMPDLLSGRILFMIQTSSEVLPLIKSGKLRALAVTGMARFKALAGVPTMKESGVADLEGIGWWGAFAPRGTPPAIVKRLSDEIAAVMRLPQVVADLDKLGMQAAPLAAEQFETFYQAELKSYVDLAQRFQLTAQ
jgi:tripartite-type tricarboxylate transporter receptor subunit TctC